MDSSDMKDMMTFACAYVEVAIAFSLRRNYKGRMQIARKDK